MIIYNCGTYYFALGAFRLLYPRLCNHYNLPCVYANDTHVSRGASEFALMYKWDTVPRFDIR